jgi:UvrD-like helicase C-terminal domain/ATP-dependent RecD-like DNA helicase SH3 domain
MLSARSKEPLGGFASKTSALYHSCPYAAVSCEVQWGLRLAWMGMVVKQKGLGGDLSRGSLLFSFHAVDALDHQEHGKGYDDKADDGVDEEPQVEGHGSGDLGCSQGGIGSGGINDKVMQIQNDYEKEVFNGDLGRIVRINLEAQEVAINFDGKKVPHDYPDLDEVVLAYAISIHKSQGSEYPAVVIPILTQHYVLLQRNLIYTAVTRGKKLVVMVGSKRALAIGIGNDKTRKRYTYLRNRLSL